MDKRLIEINEAAGYIDGKLEGRKPQVGIILGSGLGELADKIKDPTIIKYTDIPHFVQSTAIGHKGNLIAGMLSGKFVIAMQGRFHYYEGYSMVKVTLPVRVMIKLGIGQLFVSNAAGGANSSFRVGDLMIIKDHINLLPNPLIGPNLDELGPRFPDMTRPYDLGLIAKAEKVAKELGIKLRKGVYLALTGPTYETPAEYKYYRIIGADAVGMSTVPEVIVARHANIPVFGVSVITDVFHDYGKKGYEIGEEDIVKEAKKASVKMTLLFTRMIENL